MSLSPFVTFQSRFVTYLLTYPRIFSISINATFVCTIFLNSLCNALIQYIPANITVLSTTQRLVGTDHIPPVCCKSQVLLLQQKTLHPVKSPSARW